jgi:bifunctional DNA-binding transcriptional regulator/antitoxin component of YhaV-PrlF toxin-antitoxin module
LVKKRIHETRLTQKCQVYIPKELLEPLGLNPRDRVRVELDGDSLRLTPAGPSGISRWYGAFRHPTGEDDWEQLKEEFERCLVEEGSAGT